jgi:hypothetical protein
MKHALRCHDFGLECDPDAASAAMKCGAGFGALSQNRASPQRVAAGTAAAFVARLANIPDIGCTSLRAIANSGSQRTRVSLSWRL